MNYPIDDVIEGLVVFAKYDSCISTEHNVICVEPASTLSDEDTETVKELDWFWNNEWNCWSRHV